MGTQKAYKTTLLQIKSSLFSLKFYWEEMPKFGG